MVPKDAANEIDNEKGDKTAVQDWDVDLYQNLHSFVWEYGTSLVDLLNPLPGERILDVGCGSGELTHQISERGADAVGIDADPGMIEKATSEFPNVVFRCADASELERLLLDDGGDKNNERSFDAIFSNAALHWVTNAEAAVAGMSGLLKPGGRFVVEFGGRGNVETIVGTSRRVVRERFSGGAPTTTTTRRRSPPWYFPSIPEYASLLEDHGIEVVSAALYDRPTILGDGEDGMRHWLEMFGRGLFGGVPAPEIGAAIDAVVDDLRQNTDLYDPDQCLWTADYRRIRIVGTKLPPS